jgi:TonB family protein
LFSEKLAAVEQRRKALQDRIQDELAIITEWTYEIDEQQREQEELENEFIVHREVGQRPYRPVVMPWHAQAEDDRRFRRALSVALLAVLMLGITTSIWIFPKRPVQEVVEIPKQVVMLAQQERPKPPPPPPPPEEKLHEKASEKKGETPSPKTGETKQARAKAEGAGVLAFKSGFAELLQDSPSYKLGADAHVTASGQKAVGNGGRALVVAQAREGSGGINTAALSYGIAGGGGGGGGRIGGVQFARVESSIGSGGVPGGGRALGDGPGPARTDEEIQIVFDRYKAALYRIYNRELRNDPTLRGKMVLRITIEPNGEVSACTIESSDLASDVLKKEVVERVKRFNFGPKDNVAKITILYPIDFLPAA